MTEPFEIQAVTIADMLAGAGVADAAAKAQRIWDLELKIARAHATREERDDWSKGTQVWSQADFAKKAPGLDWKSFFEAAQLGPQQKFDAFGFIALVIGLVGMQMVLDRGAGAEWFYSAEIWVYAGFAALGR